MKFYNITVTAKLIEDGAEQKNQSGKGQTMYCNVFRVTVQHEGKKTSFKYHGSHNDWQQGKTELDDDNLKFALYCFESDARMGKESFESFCSELGYDSDSRTAEKIHKECIKQAARFEKLNIPQETIEKIWEECQ